MPDPHYAAFISYAHRYRSWVETFHRNLELSLKHLGKPVRVFLDTVDLGSGRSWVRQLQAGLDQAEHLVLVATPEAVASPRVADEWEAIIATRRDWDAGHFHLVRLVDGPLPPFLEKIQYLEFREYDDASYRHQLTRLVAGLLGRKDPRDLPALPAEIEIPAPPESSLPTALRARLVDWLAPLLHTPLPRRAVEAVLGLDRNALEEHPSSACAASAALVLATGDDDPLTAAVRIVDVLSEELGEDRPREIEALRPLRTELEALRARDAEPGLLGGWLRKVVSDHERVVPYFQQRAELDLLDRIFVQLELRPELRPQALAGTEGERLDRPLRIGEVLELDPAAHPWVTRRWVVLGDPGAGKTTLLRHLAATLARQGRPPWVPVFEALPRLMREPEWLLDRIARQMRRAGLPAEGLAAVLERVAEEGRLLLLLDGLDEVARDERDEAEALLRQLADRWPATPLVVASRPIGYRRPDAAFQELELLPFDAGRRREFLARWFGRARGEPDRERAERAAAILEKEAGLRELAGNPLYLTLMALLLEKGSSPERHRTRLYDQVFALLLEGGHRQPPTPMDAQQVTRQVLRHLAYAMTLENRDAEPLGDLEARLYQPGIDPLRKQLERVPRWRQSLRPFLDDLAERTGILGPHDGPEADWRFWHRTFREALAAEALEETLGAEGEEAVLKHARAIAGDESRWAEPYALLAGRVEEPDALVRSLVRENRALGLRAVATAQGLEDETLREILELSDKWRERIKVYERIPELLDDPERALALLDQLRQRIRNGNDLFFIDQTVGAVAERWPDARRTAQQLRARFYDHIPAPPEELFRWIETPVDGRVPLWPEIPAGTFQMGSLDDEEGSFDRERPRHQVTLTSAFALAAVPVTNAQYAAFDPERVPEDKLGDQPVIRVTWYEAMAFCRWLSLKLPWARGARLPTEEEWEYACRAGSHTRFWSGDDETDLARVGWYDENSGSRTHRVGEKPAKPWGLYDVHGNVWEWMLSAFTDYSGREAGLTVDPAAIDPADLAAPPGEGRVIRGGSYWNGARNVRSAYRVERNPELVIENRGFRVLLPAAPRP